MGTLAADQNSVYKITKIDFDTPLQVQSALDLDLLSRRGFAEIAASSLREVSESEGFVLSVEGAWGSGKSSTLAMIQALLEQDTSVNSPVIVHFNPWLIGEKDALLRQFLSSIANAIQLGDHSGNGIKVAKELKAYSKVFDLVKLIPGAEPWASIVKSVVQAAGDATGAVAEYKAPDVEAYKRRVDKALRAFKRPVVVFIDDIDRLFPTELFEMIRIIKAVGGLPRVGYVVAWDAPYVSAALDNLKVPHAKSYLDKIVQVRMSLPNLSLRARGKLFDSALEKIDSKAFYPYFDNQEKRLGQLYQAGLGDLLEQPRDVVRVFNTLRTMEPLLRGEILLADILGLAALSVKAPSVFELMKRKPRFFVGRLATDAAMHGESSALIAAGAADRQSAFDACGISAVQAVVYFLFPDVAAHDGSRSHSYAADIEGALSHPASLVIALQLGVTDTDVSLDAIRRYLQMANYRAEIEASLGIENCEEFLIRLGDIGKTLPKKTTDTLENTCLAIAKLPDQDLFVQRSRATHGSFRTTMEDLALLSIRSLISHLDEASQISLYARVAAQGDALSCASEILRRSYLHPNPSSPDGIILGESRKVEAIRIFADNVLQKARSHDLMKINRVGLILWTLGRLSPSVCSDVFSTIKNADTSMDEFALHFLGSSWDSSKGQAYSLPVDLTLTEAYCPLDELKEHALRRLQDAELKYPTRAAWQSVIDGKTLYGIDGAEVIR